MGATENAGFKVQRNLGLHFVKTAQMAAKTSTSLQLSVSDMLIFVLTFLLSQLRTLAMTG